MPPPQKKKMPKIQDFLGFFTIFWPKNQHFSKNSKTNGINPLGKLNGQAIDWFDQKYVNHLYTVTKTNLSFGQTNKQKFFMDYAHEINHPIN